MKSTFKRPVRAALLTVATAGLLLGTAGVALACYTDDNRAVPTEGNVTTCAKAKLPGTDLKPSDITFTGGTQQDKYLNITALGEGVTVTAIVIKGGDGYNTYEPGKRGLPANPPWEKLRSPLNGGGQQATISHWFLCGSVKPPTTKPSEPTKTTTVKPSEPTKTTTATSKPPTSTKTSAPETTSSTPAVPVGGSSGGNGGLADTGFDKGWLIWVGGALLLGGVGLVTVGKVRRKG
ncbi:hypothetical protein [Amycolatopsis sp. NPDC059657]|uniref:hypothetical protein n=1 Tax=Amycolatopsis sp. NPDC059657 TaxID=3346899 RepID=UPI00366F1116